MIQSPNDNSPPVGFYFLVEILEVGGVSSPASGASFQEVSGISASLETEEIEAGGQNRFTHRIPGRAKFENLVLKRGLLAQSSGLAKWCTATFENSLTKPIEPKTISVKLLDANAADKGALVIWVFHNAYPVKWEVASLNAQTNELIVESIAFAYSYFDRK